MQHKPGDCAFLTTLLVNSKLLHYAATRVLWAKTIVDRWDHYIGVGDRNIQLRKKKDSWIMYYDIDYSAHGLITDMQDYCTDLKEQYRLAWLSENMPYRLGTMPGRFDVEYIVWRDLYLKVRDYEDLNEIDKHPRKFEELFGVEQQVK